MKKSCEKADFYGANILFAGSVNASLNIYMPKSLEKIRSNLFAVIHFQKPEGIYALRCIIKAILQAKFVI